MGFIHSDPRGLVRIVAKQTAYRWPASQPASGVNRIGPDFYSGYFVSGWVRVGKGCSGCSGFVVAWKEERGRKSVEGRAGNVGNEYEEMRR